MYSALKTVHITCVALSISGFALRTWWMARTSRLLQHPAVRVGPHIIDTLLLASGVAMAWQVGWEGVRHWLPAKLLGLVLYIMLGAIALHRGRTRMAKVAAAIAAVLVFLYIIGVATHKEPNVLTWIQAS
jgi:uncharacterized membrane protein SirB2